MCIRHLHRMTQQVLILYKSLGPVLSHLQWSYLLAWSYRGTSLGFQKLQALGVSCFFRSALHTQATNCWPICPEITVLPAKPPPGLPPTRPGIASYITVLYSLQEVPSPLIIALSEHWHDPWPTVPVAHSAWCSQSEAQVFSPVMKRCSVQGVATIFRCG